jgi:hypothetical protein
MTISKLCGLILFYFLSRAAFASNCDDFQGYKLKEKLCFNNSVKGWISAKCLDEKTKCDAVDFFGDKKKMPESVSVNGQNPAALYCHNLKLDIVILKDSHNNEQSFCVFKDKTMVDANAVERHVR